MSSEINNIFEKLHEQMKEFGVPLTATTQTFNEISKGANMDINHEDKFSEKMKDFDEKMSDWMQRFENGHSFKTFKKRVEKTTLPPPPIKRPKMSETVREKELGEMVERLKRELSELKSLNETLKKTIKSQSEQLNRARPHLETYAKLLDKKEKRAKQGQSIKKIYDRVVQWFNE